MALAEGFGPPPTEVNSFAAYQLAYTRMVLEEGLEPPMNWM